MEASRKNQSHFCGWSYVSTDCASTAEVSVKSVAMRARCNRVNDATLDLLKGDLINIVVFGGQDKLCHKSHWSRSESLCILHRWKYEGDNNKSKNKRQVLMCSDWMVHLCISFFNLFHKQITVHEIKPEVGKTS